MIVRKEIKAMNNIDEIIRESEENLKNTGKEIKREEIEYFDEEDIEESDKKPNEKIVDEITDEIISDICRECIHRNVCGKGEKIKSLYRDVKEVFNKKEYKGFRIEIQCEDMFSEEKKKSEILGLINISN